MQAAINDQKICSFDDHVQNALKFSNVFLIGVAGGTASGKTTVCHQIMNKLYEDENLKGKVAFITQHSFYYELNEEDHQKALKGLYNFDHPNAFNSEACIKIMKALMHGNATQVPIYDYKTNSCIPGQSVIISGANVVIFEGILLFYFKELRDLFNLKLFVDLDADIRLARRVLRDVNERNRDLDTVLTQYIKFVKPCFDEFCLPTKKFADVIIPKGVAVDLIVQHVRDLLQRGSVKSEQCCHPEHICQTFVL